MKESKIKRILNIGDRFTLLEIVEHPFTYEGVRMVKCRCDCGKETTIRVDNLFRIPANKSCGCLKIKHASEMGLKTAENRRKISGSENIKIGDKFGHLTVVSSAYKVKKSLSVDCVCSCGKSREAVIIGDLLRKKSISCIECSVKRTINGTKTHGGSESRLYSVWLNLFQRCYNPNFSYFHRYGGRGITVDLDWFDFANFREWSVENGYNDTLQLDRIDNNKGYAPENCRYTTSKVNNNNRENNIFFEAWGEKKTVAEWAIDCRCKIKGPTLRYRIKSKRITERWSFEDILTKIKLKRT